MPTVASAPPQPFDVLCRYAEASPSQSEHKAKYKTGIRYRDDQGNVWSGHGRRPQRYLDGIQSGETPEPSAACIRAAIVQFITSGSQGGRPREEHSLEVRLSDDLDQTFIAESFQSLYTSRGRPTLSRSEMGRRYEFCEDLAQQLADPSATLSFAQDLSPEEVLMRCLAGLRTAESNVSEPEALWVVRRTAELLGWDAPA